MRIIVLFALVALSLLPTGVSAHVAKGDVFFGLNGWVEKSDDETSARLNVRPGYLLTDKLAVKGSVFVQKFERNDTQFTVSGGLEYLSKSHSQLK